MAKTARGHKAFERFEVDAIRARYALGESQGRLAREFGVTINTIGRIVREETYPTNPRMRIETPVAPRLDIDINNPLHVKEMVERINRNVQATGGVQPPAPAEALVVKYETEGARGYFRTIGEWPKGYHPTDEDRIAVSRPRGGFGMAIPPADEPEPTGLPKELLENLPKAD